MNRILLLVPAILGRLDEDLLAGNIRPDLLEQKPYIIDGLEVLDKCLLGMQKFDQTNLLDQPVLLFSKALELGEEVRMIPKFAKSGRFFDDVGRLLPDVRLVQHTWKNMKRNRQRQPDVPDAEDQYRPQAWYEYYEKKMLMEEPLIRVPEIEGLSKETLEQGMELQRKASEELEREIEREREIRDIHPVRSAVFDPERPERFLDLEEMPNREELSEEELQQPFEFPSENDDVQFEESLPELREWTEVTSESSPGEQGNPEPEEPVGESFDTSFPGADNPVVEWFQELSANLFDHFDVSKENQNELYENRPELKYIQLLAVKPGSRIAGSYTWVDEKTNPAPLHGAYLHAISCLRRIIRAIERCDSDVLDSLEDRAWNGIETIERILS